MRNYIYPLHTYYNKEMNLLMGLFYSKENIIDTNDIINNLFYKKISAIDIYCLIDKILIKYGRNSLNYLPWVREYKREAKRIYRKVEE